MRIRSLFAVALVLATSSLAAAQQPARGYLGLAPAPAVAGSNAIVVAEVDPDGPSAKAGLRQGDRILKVNDQALAGPEAFGEMLAKMKAGDKLAFVIVRGGNEEKVEVTLGDRPAADRPPAAPDRVPAPGEQEKPTAFLGIHMQDLSPPLKARLGVNVDLGIIVAEVTPNSPAARAGFQVGDVITQAGDKPVANARQLASAIQQTGAGKELVIKFARGKDAKEMKVTLAEAPADLIRPRPQPRDPRVVDVPRVGDEGGRVKALERKVDELEKRIQELERRVNK